METYLMNLNRLVAVVLCMGVLVGCGGPAAVGEGVGEEVGMVRQVTQEACPVNDYSCGGDGEEEPEPVDYDGDGFYGDADACPIHAENFNGYQDGDGCPDREPSRIDSRLWGSWLGVMRLSGSGEEIFRAEPTFTEPYSSPIQALLTEMCPDPAAMSAQSPVTLSGSGSTVEWSGAYFCGSAMSPTCASATFTYTFIRATVVRADRVAVSATGIISGCGATNTVTLASELWRPL